MLVKKQRLIGEEIASIKWKKRKKRFVKKYKRNEDYLKNNRKFCMTGGSSDTKKIRMKSINKGCVPLGKINGWKVEFRKIYWKLLHLIEKNFSILYNQLWHSKY